MIVSATINGVPTAAALDQMHLSRQVSVSVDRVWSTITSLSTDPTWNQVDSMKVIKNTDNTIEADTTVDPQNANAQNNSIFILGTSGVRN